MKNRAPARRSLSNSSMTWRSSLRANPFRSVQKKKYDANEVLGVFTLIIDAAIFPITYLHDLWVFFFVGPDY